MKKRTKQVLVILKPKSKALGFSREELEGIAADVANNLELDEEASDEDVNAEIEKQVNAVLPYLKIAQKTAQRTIQSFKDSQDLMTTRSMTTMMTLPATRNQSANRRKRKKSISQHGRRHSLLRTKPCRPKSSV